MFPRRDKNRLWNWISCNTQCPVIFGMTSQMIESVSMAMRKKFLRFHSMIVLEALMDEKSHDWAETEIATQIHNNQSRVRLQNWHNMLNFLQTAHWAAGTQRSWAWNADDDHLWPKTAENTFHMCLQPPSLAAVTMNSRRTTNLLLNLINHVSRPFVARDEHSWYICELIKTTFATGRVFSEVYGRY